MTDHELDQLRREKWHLNGAPLRTLDEARRFLESVGFCLMYPMRPPLLAPTFIGAWTGSDKTSAHAAACLCRSAGARGHRSHGASAAQS